MSTHMATGHGGPARRARPGTGTRGPTSWRNASQPGSRAAAELGRAGAAVGRGRAVPSGRGGAGPSRSVARPVIGRPCLTWNQATDARVRRPKTPVDRADPVAQPRQAPLHLPHPVRSAGALEAGAVADRPGGPAVQRPVDG